MEDKNNRFKTRIKPLLEYIGTIGAILMCIAYIVIVVVMVFGLKFNIGQADNIIFAVINAVIGFIIMQFLKIQGIDFAKNIEENKIIIEKYYNNKTPDKTVHSITHFWVVSIIKDILIKGLSIIIMSLGVMYIVVKGSQNYTLLLLALINLVMFICFGILSLAKAYEFYNNNHIPYLKEKLKEGKILPEEQNVKI